MKRPVRVTLWVVGVLIVVGAGLSWLGARAITRDYVFDNGRSLQQNIAGRWDWSTRATPCSDSAHTIAFSDDGAAMTITQDFPVSVDSGEADWSITTYDILRTTPSRIRGAIRGETRLTDAGQPVVWDLVVTGEDSYAWHRTDWQSWGRTAQVIRCPEAAVADSRGEVSALSQLDLFADSDELTGEEEETHATPAVDVADLYKGFIVSNHLPHQRIALEISVFARDDSATTGWLTSGPPLNMRGPTWFFRKGDSLFLVTNTATDTILWESAALPAMRRIGGDYWVTAGRNDGAGGTWELHAAERFPRSTLGLLVVLVAGGLLLGVCAVAAHGTPGWWSWRGRRPIGGTALDQLRLTGIGGWLILVIVGQTLVALGQTLKIGEVGEALGSTWMLGHAIAWLRPALIAESAFHVFQILGIVTGVILIVRRSRITPMYWITFLALMLAYVVADTAMSATLQREISLLFGAEAGAEAGSEMRQAAAANGRLAFAAAVWMLYWVRSRRVALTFSATGRDGRAE